MLRYRLLGRSGLRVSEICLGTMSFGDQWGFGADTATSHQVLDAYAEAGGNFLDTANKYHGGQTEEIVGAWLEGKRDRMVVATKYTLAMDHTDPNAAGNQRKNLVRSVEDSLRRMKTDYIDLLWVHAWDEHTPYEETMRGLDDLVRAGKVLYLGVSDTPAWVVSASNVAAELRGWSPFVAMQIEYSLLQRTPERDLLPMADHFGLSVLAWGPLGAGVLTGKYTRQGVDNDSLRKGGNDARGRTSEKSLAIARAVDAVADELGASSAQVAAAWVQAQGYRYIPHRRRAEDRADHRHAGRRDGGAQRRAPGDAGRAEPRRAGLPARLPRGRRRQGPGARRDPHAHRRAPLPRVSGLSAEQRARFAEEGYLLLRAALDADQVARLRARIARSLDADGRLGALPGSLCTSFCPELVRDPELLALLELPALREAAGALLGAAPVGVPKAQIALRFPEAIGEAPRPWPHLDGLPTEGQRAGRPQPAHPPRRPLPDAAAHAGPRQPGRLARLAPRAQPRPARAGAPALPARARRRRAAGARRPAGPGLAAGAPGRAGRPGPGPPPARALRRRQPLDAAARGDLPAAASPRGRAPTRWRP